MLEQIIIEVPEFAKEIFPGLPADICRKLKSGVATVSAEESFLGEQGNRRRADLAITEDGAIVALAEVKYEDHLAHSNYAQIKDYITLTKKENKPFFTYLTQYAPEESHHKLIKQAKNKNPRIKHLYYRDIYRKSKNYDHPVIKWFTDFLTEEHVVYKDAFEKNALGSLKLLMVKGLYVKHAHGLGKLASSSNSPLAADLLGSLVGNIVALSDWFYGSFREHLGNRFVPGFVFDPEFDVKKIIKDIKNNKGNNKFLLDRNSRTGGYLWIGASGRLSGKNGYVSFGYLFTLDLLTKKLTGEFSAEIWQSKKFNWNSNENFTLKKTWHFQSLGHSNLY